MKGCFPGHIIKETDTLLKRFKEFSGVQRITFDILFPEILKIVFPRKRLILSLKRGHRKTCSLSSAPFFRPAKILLYMCTPVHETLFPAEEKKDKENLRLFSKIPPTPTS